MTEKQGMTQSSDQISLGGFLVYCLVCAILSIWLYGLYRLLFSRASDVIQVIGAVILAAAYAISTGFVFKVVKTLMQEAPQ